MKAKEWAQKFKDALDSGIRDKDFMNAIDQYIDETLKLVNSRGKTPAALEGCVREQLTKWEAICRLGPKDDDGPILDRQTLEYALEHTTPELWKEYSAIAVSNYQKKQERIIRSEYKKEIAQSALHDDPGLRLAGLISAILGKQQRLDELKETINPST